MLTTHQTKIFLKVSKEKRLYLHVDYETFLNVSDQYVVNVDRLEMIKSDYVQERLKNIAVNFRSSITRPKIKKN